MHIRSQTVSDGTILRYRHFLPKGAANGYVIALHGIQSHSGWYEHSSRRLAEAGFDVRFLDRRGSGLSEGRRGHTPHWRRLVNDTTSFLQKARWERDEVSPLAPIILLAVSWGARLAMTVVTHRPELVDGLVLLYPGIFAQYGPGPIQKAQLRLASWLGVRYRKASIPLTDPALFTAEAAGQEFIRNDPLALHETTVGFLLADRQLTRFAQQSGPAIQCPTLLMLAGRDRIVDVPATRHYFETIRSRDKRLVEFPDAAHTLEFDPCFESYISQLIHWLGNLTSPLTKTATPPPS